MRIRSHACACALLLAAIPAFARAALAQAIPPSPTVIESEPSIAFIDQQTRLVTLSGVSRVRGDLHAMVDETTGSRSPRLAHATALARSSAGDRAVGTVTGTLVGAGAGAIVGFLIGDHNASRHRRDSGMSSYGALNGLAIGAAVGAVLGGIVGFVTANK